MSIELSILEECLTDVYLTGMARFIPAEDKATIASLRTRLYRAKEKMKSTFEDIDKKVEIATGLKFAVSGIIIRKPLAMIIFKENEKGEFEPLPEQKSIIDNSLKRKLSLMKKDGVNEKEMLKSISKEERKEALEIWAGLS
jgi:hypothetical protein